MSAKPTISDLMARARRAIDEDEQFIYDVASETGQIVANVKHMRWFRLAVAQHLIDNTKRWQHLTLEKDHA